MQPPTYGRDDLVTWQRHDGNYLVIILARFSGWYGSRGLVWLFGPLDSYATNPLTPGVYHADEGSLSSVTDLSDETVLRLIGERDEEIARERAERERDTSGGPVGDSGS